MNILSGGSTVIRLSICALVLSSSPAFADPIPIRITRGSMMVDRETAAHLIASGDRGFSISAGGDFHGGAFLPWGQCIVADDCMPGLVISLFANWNGSDLTGRITLEGETFPLGIWTSENASGLVQFTGSVVAPEFDGGLFREVSAPFLFTGNILLPAVPDVTPSLALSGAGTATLRLRWSDTESQRGWTFDRAVYAFDSPTPVPEPGSMALTGLGLAALAARRVRRRMKTSS
jgi:hypothetical protein